MRPMMTGELRLDARKVARFSPPQGQRAAVRSHAAHDAPLPKTPKGAIMAPGFTRDQGNVE